MAENKTSISSKQQVRLMLLTVPRSISTVMTKCLSFVEDSLVGHEPYVSAFYYGPDNTFLANPEKEVEDHLASFKEDVSRLAFEYPSNAYDDSKFSYKWVQEQLEEAHTDKKFIFCKDMAFVITGHESFLPKGYRYLFLIRHPLKVFPSWKKLYSKVFGHKQLDEWHQSKMPAGKGYKELSDLLDLVRDKHDQEAIIIDADDLLENPKGILSALFKTIGLPFDEKILNWEEGDAVTKTWFVSRTVMAGNQIGQYYKNALDSSNFQKPRDLPDRSSLSPDILRCVDASMAYYEKMYSQRLKPAE